MNVNEIAKELTREEFLKIVKGQCPKEFGLNNDECEDFEDCSECREHVIKDIQFKGEENEFIEKLSAMFQVGDKVVHTDSREFSNCEKIATITKIEKSQCGDYNLIWLDVGLGWVSEDDIELHKEEVNIEIQKNTIQWTFNLKQFQDDSIAILCPTVTEFDTLFKTLITNGIELDKSNYEYSYSDEDVNICYDLEDNDLEYCDKSWYHDNSYKIYDFDKVDFSQVWNKESIDEVALHNRKQTDEFDITKVKYITREQHNTTRPLRNGDIVGDKCNYGIVYGNSVVYMTANCTETINLKAYCEFIPVELIESNRDIQNAISKFMSSNLKDYYVIKDYFIPIQEEPKPKTICKVEFVVDADNLREFILEDEEAIEGEIVEVKTGGNNYQYARVKEVEIRELTECEVVLFKTCRKLS